MQDTNNYTAFDCSLYRADKTTTSEKCHILSYILMLGGCSDSKLYFSRWNKGIQYIKFFGYFAYLLLFLVTTVTEE